MRSTIFGIKKTSSKIHQKFSYGHCFYILDHIYYGLINVHFFISKHDEIKCLKVDCGNIVLMQGLKQRIHTPVWHDIGIYALLQNRKRDNTGTNINSLMVRRSHSLTNPLMSSFLVMSDIIQRKILSLLLKNPERAARRTAY